jgi:hypothetical protein
MSAQPSVHLELYSPDRGHETCWIIASIPFCSKRHVGKDNAFRKFQRITPGMAEHTFPLHARFEN